MGRTCYWLKQIPWPRLMLMAQGSVFLSQEVTAGSMAMNKMNDYPTGQGKNIIENHIQSPRMIKTNFPKNITSPSRGLLVFILLLWFRSGLPLPWTHPEFFPPVVWCALRILKNRFYYLHKQRKFRSVKILKEKHHSAAHNWTKNIAQGF